MEKLDVINSPDKLKMNSTRSQGASPVPERFESHSIRSMDQIRLSLPGVRKSKKQFFFGFNSNFYGNFYCRLKKFWGAD